MFGQIIRLQDPYPNDHYAGSKLGPRTWVRTRDCISKFKAMTIPNRQSCSSFPLYVVEYWVGFRDIENKSQRCQGKKVRKVVSICIVSFKGHRPLGSTYVALIPKEMQSLYQIVYLLRSGEIPSAQEATSLFFCSNKAISAQ